MRNTIFRILFVFSIFLSVRQSTASHMIGADMSYQYLGNGRYKITAHVYRDCRGIAFNNPTFGVFAGTNGGNGCGGKTLEIRRTAIRDVTPICAGAALPCSPPNTGATGEGAEEHVYEAVVDFDSDTFKNYLNNSNCCEVTFYLGQCCRTGSITTGPNGADFWTTTMINICNVKKTSMAYNNSPVFTSSPLIFTCCNKPYVYNHGIIDSADNDLITYKKGHALAALPNTSVNYSTPFSAEFPVTSYCVTPGKVDCTPNPNANPPRGYFLDTMNGDIVFMPVKCDEIGVVVIELSEYRKDSMGQLLLVGRSRRDMMIIVKDNCQKNNPPEISGNQTYSICEGDSICFNIGAKDAIALPGQSNADTVSLSWDGGIKGGKFTILNPTDREKTARFCWKATPGSARSGPYTFTVRATDQACPFINQAYRSFQIFVCKPGASVRQQFKPEFSVFPQPAKSGELLHIPGLHGNYIADLLNASGQMIAHVNISDERLQLPELNPGIYLLKTEKQGRKVVLRLAVSE